MTLEEMIAGVPLTTAVPPRFLRETVTGLEFDSRKVAPGNLFFAFPGQRTDGRRFAAQALERGALAVVSESETPADGQAWIQVEHGRQALARMAKRFYQDPDESIFLTGVTGTNGKTTSAFAIDAMLRHAGFITGLAGTIEYRIGAQVLPAINTTPESLDFIRLLADLRQQGGTHCTLEVSSHGLTLGRIYGLRFHTVSFTNLTRDHLDFHGTMDAYFAAKELLFQGAGGPPPRFAVINSDDAYGRRIQTAAGTEVMTYGLKPGATLRAANIKADFNGVRFDVEYPGGRQAIASQLSGVINVYNLLGAFGAGLSYGLSAPEIAAGLESCRAVPGRFEKVVEGQPFLVVVDYAHTDDALKSTLATARALEPRRIITVFGCGGDRDRAKRPLMGQAAAQASDFVIVTSDNPRSEDPLTIIADAVVGVQRTSTRYSVQPDRKQAIEQAITEAGPGDIVLLAGKGHETYQVLKDRTIAFDDREVARRILRGYGYGKKASA